MNSYNSPVWTETKIPRNNRRRPPAKIFRQSLVWYCSRFYTPPIHTFCTHDRICSEEHFGAIINRIAGGCATRCLSSTVVDARQSSSSLQHGPSFASAWSFTRLSLVTSHMSRLRDCSRVRRWSPACPGSSQHVTAYDKGLVFRTNRTDRFCAVAVSAINSLVVTFSSSCSRWSVNAEMPDRHDTVSAIPLYN